MKATISLDGILAFLNSISLTAQNKRWLGEHLIEQARHEQQTCDAQKEHTRILQGLDAAFKDAQLAREGKLEGRPLMELLNEI